jgi:RNA polymerase sigma factor (sigma-70 family)
MQFGRRVAAVQRARRDQTTRWVRTMKLENSQSSEEHGSETCLEQCEGLVADLIRRKAWQLVKSGAFTQSDREDIEQNLRLKLLKSQSSYDPEEGPWIALARTVVERHAATLLRDRLATKRGHHQTISLQRHVKDPDGGSIELGNTLLSEQQEKRRGYVSRSHLDSWQLIHDIAEVFRNLPPDQRELAEQLKTKSISQAARDLNVPRTTLYELMRKLRRRCERAGLQDYL